ncbi:hypothetical protein FZEAL_3347 [Fusarium zealandicum]|uniref:DUF7732 domain-containing protein n=1 Tax=Fusarium zealandicum TaxID=1053134 RepID=A0A8H4UNX0_9HYPO|nr:hypothetical protein FZEAL_3347 [Fusarium zealandicum]
MRLDVTVLYLSLLASAAASVVDSPRHVKRIESEPSVDEHELYKRRGGGGGGGRGGGSSSGGSKSGGSSSGGGSRSGGRSGSGSSSSGSGSSRSGSGSSRSGSGSSRSGSSRGSYRTGSSPGSTSNRGGSSSGSNQGGGSRGGSGPRPNFAGGRYYPGGAAAPYRSGGRSPLGIAPFFFIGAAIAFWPGVWLYGAHTYPYENQYHYYNETSEKDESRDVICGCAQYSVCGCDDNNSTEYYDELIGNGSYEALNKSIVNVAKVNGTMTILINGTLPNGTTVPEDEEDTSADEDDSNAAASMRSLVEALGYWPAVAAIMAAVFVA